MRSSALFLFLLSLPGLVPAQSIRTVPIASGLVGPTDIQSPHDGSGRLFVLEQAGTVRVVRDGTVLPVPFLDIRDRVLTGDERGLLGLAFSPTYAESGRFYLNYTNLEGNTVIAMYRVSANPDMADPASQTILMTVPQPFANHNGGGMQFGPDGFLYIGMGDGGSAGDPQGNAQNLGTLLGKMLRIDVEGEPGQVRIPPGNPFADQPGARPEIWAYGLRNPWRFAFDQPTGLLWIADVGQRMYEEVNAQPANIGGQNYGWRVMEGAHCYNADSCNQEGLVLPVAEYDHGSGCSITGGYVYRGQRSPGLRGTYLYSDFCSGTIWGLRVANSGITAEVLAETDFGVTTFGQDEAGEIYVADARSSTIYRIHGIAAPQFVGEQVVNSASYASGLVAGSLATVFVSGVRDLEGLTFSPEIPLATQLEGVTVTVDGRRAPLQVIANVGGREQVNFQVPFETPAGQSVTVVVTRDGLSSPSVRVPVRAVQPAIYTLDGSNAIAVHVDDGSLVTAANPLRSGEYAFIYASGLGDVSNEPPTGGDAPADPPASAQGPVRVLLNNTPSQVQFAGLAPGFVGVYQVNFQVPAGMAGDLTLVLETGGVRSPVARVPVQ